jgi:hypothetical protein
MLWITMQQNPMEESVCGDVGSIYFYKLEFDAGSSEIST